MLRRILLVLFVLLILVGAALAASGNGQGSSEIRQVVHNSKWHTAEIVQGKIKTSGDSFESAAKAFIASRKDLFKLDQPDKELRLKNKSSDKLGKTHVRFEQVYNGLRVWGREKIVHFDDPNAIYLIGGQTIPTPNIPTSPKLDSSSAVAAARASIKSLTGGAEVTPTTELLVYPADDARAHLAWLVTLTGVKVGSIRYRVFVDALSGQVLHQFNDVEDDGPAVGSGVDVQGATQTIHTYQFGSAYRMVDASRAMYQPPVGNLTGVIATYNNNKNGGTLVQDPNGDNNFNDNLSLMAAVSGHVNASLTYEYFRTTFSRNSIDDNGLHIIVNVHDPAYVNNAYWDGAQVNFADGDGANYLPFSGGLDVVAHELTHGVTQYTAGLNYEFQSGALNESMSDFFGAMVDRDDWLVGDEIRVSWPYFLRSMSDPHQGPQPGRFPFGYQPATMSEYQDLPISNDNGGVHINSGIPNKAGYLVAEAITREKAESIWYRTLTVYLTPSSDFNFWSTMILQSAIDLYGDPSTEVTGVESALTQVGFGLVIANPPEINPLSVPLGTTNDTQIVITNRRAESVTWTGVTSAKGALAIGTSGPSTLASGASMTITATASAVGKTNCNLGLVQDTIVVTTTDVAVPTISIPVAVTYSFVPVGPQTRTISSSCMTTSLNNVPSINDMVRNGNDVVSKATVIFTYKNGSDTVMYTDLYSTGSFALIDSLASGTLGPDQSRTLRFASSDSKIQGKVRYQYEPTDVAGCGYVAADYWITNPCGSSITLLSGVLSDFDVNTAGTNQAAYDAGNKMIYIRDATNTAAAALALLGSTSPRNLRAINNPSLIWNGLTPGNAYKEMVATSNVNGSTGDDWSALLTFGQNTLNAGDTVHYRMAYLYSTSGSSGLATILSQINAPSCCTGTTGNVNMTGIIDLSDLSLLIAYLTASPRPTLPCPDEANINATGIIDLSDLSMLIAHLTTQPAPTLPNCP